MTIQESIEYHVDKGISRKSLFQEMLRQDACTEDCPPHTIADLKKAFKAMLEKGTLTMGSFQGETDHVVVSRWSPNTAAAMKR